ncbi:MAG: ATP-binding cassette domain-containing protein [Gemmatimonadota bacterium]|nr:ATP-binding cassette domain-containing protein [Gemmatimonadota bacterium]
MTPLLEFREVRLSRTRRGSAAWEPGAGITTDAIVSFEVRPHETLAIIGDGQSGAGLLAGLALGLDRPTGGSVLTMGTEIATLPRWEQLAFRRRVGYLPEGDGLLQNLSLRDNVRLPLRFGSDFRPREIEGRVDVIMAQLRIARVAAMRPAEASLEDGRRAALARALAFDPELVILEAPFEGLPDRTAAELLEAARGGETEHGGRRAVLITSPDLPALLRPRVDRMLRLVAGRLEVAA